MFSSEEDRKVRKEQKFFVQSSGKLQVVTTSSASFASVTCIKDVD